MSIPEAKAANPTIAVGKVYELNQTGTTFRVNITAADITEMGGWILSLKWDPNMTKVTTGDPAGLLKRTVRYNIYEGNFMRAAGGTNFLMNAINTTNGTITSLACLFKVTSVSVKGSGLLAWINFTLLHVGTSTINITASKLQDRSGKELTHDAVNGLITDQPQPPPPPIWMESWFLTTVLAVAIVVTVPTVTIVRLAGKPVPTEAELKKIREFTEKEAEGKPFTENSK